jgi:hypothetical protein
MPGSRSLYRKIISPKFVTERLLTETPIDRIPFDRTPIDRKTIWLKQNLNEHRLTECRLTESSFVSTRIYFTKRVIWPKTKLSKGHLSNDRNDIWPKVNLTKSFFQKMVMTESSFRKWSFDRKFIWLKALRKMVIRPKKFLRKG